MLLLLLFLVKNVRGLYQFINKLILYEFGFGGGVGWLNFILLIYEVDEDDEGDFGQ